MPTAPVTFTVYVQGANARPEQRKIRAASVQSFTLEPCGSGLRALVRSEELAGLDCFVFLADEDEAHTFTRYAVQAVCARILRGV